MPERIFVCTDLDRTLIPNGPQSESSRARERFAAFVAREEVCLAFVTGRDRRLVEDAMNHYALPTPDYVVADVGTTIYEVGRRRAWRPVDAWQRNIERDWAGHGDAEIRSLVADLSLIRPQESRKQNRHKASFYVPLHADRVRLASVITERFERAGVLATLVWSIDEPAGVGLLDVLPASASKYHAIEACLEYFEFDHQNTVFCGDSGNDMEVLVSPIASVLVANAEADVREQAIAQSAANGSQARLYIAKGGFCDMNGNYAAGILEGIAHYFPHVRAWIECD